MNIPHNQVPEEFQKYKSADPFPSIFPALLNSADIHNYIATTGMIRPYDQSKLKSGSYGIAINGEVHLWNNKREKSISKLEKEGDEFILQPNSIAFVFLSTEIFLPDYIAMRFNLKIEHVHKGILIGTGPLVDPGFVGNLFIPLHNLTANSYTFRFGQGLIWVEFTKLSPNPRWAATEDSVVKTGQYMSFKDEKKWMKPADYFDQATNGNAVVSSIPDVFRNAEEAANNAEEAANKAKTEVDKVRDRLNWAAFTGVIIFVATTIVAIIFGVFPIISLVHDVDNTATSTKELLSATKQQLAQTEEKQEQLKSQIERLEMELKNTKTSSVSRKR